MKSTQVLLVAAFAVFSAVSHAAGVTGYVDKRGIFLEADAGVFFAFGGYKDAQAGRTSRAVSAVEPYAGILAGYEFSPNIGVGLRLGSAFVAGAARSQTDIESPTDFGMHMVNAEVMAGFLVAERWHLQGAIFGGPCILSPVLSVGTSPLAWDAGARVGFRFATLLTDVVVGLDVSGYATILPSPPQGSGPILWSMAITPAIKYIF